MICAAFWKRRNVANETKYIYADSKYTNWVEVFLPTFIHLFYLFSCSVDKIHTHLGTIKTISNAKNNKHAN